MARVAWSNDLSVGIDAIDKQHKRILGYINELDDVIISGKADRRERIAALVDSTIDYTKSHFDFEDALLEGVGYPFVEGRQRGNESFVERVIDCRDRLNAGEDIAPSMQDALSCWLISHIKNEDADYAKWFSGQVGGFLEEGTGNEA